MKIKHIALTICIIIIAVLCGSIVAGANIGLLPAPKILGCKDITYKLGDLYPNLLDGITAYDYNGNDITNKIVIDDSLVDNSKVGDYPLFYYIADKYGKTNAVQVILSITAEMPYFTGVDDLYFEVATENPDYLSNVRAYDSNDCNLDSKIIVNSLNVNLNTVGEYVLYYSISDSFGFTTTVKVNVYVVESFKPIFNGVKPFEYIIGITQCINYKKGVTAYSYKGIDISSRISVTDENVDLHTEGEYVAYYTVTDFEGNSNMAEFTVSVLVAEEDNFPTIEGIVDFDIDLGGSLPDWRANVIAFDAVDGDITNKIIITGDVDVNIIGVYFIYYSVTNSSGKEFKTSAKVTVRSPISDDTDPLISGHKDLDIMFGTSISDINFLDGITAYDDFDGDITDNLRYDLSKINFYKIGIYSLQYYVSDSSGNVARIDVSVKIYDGTSPIFYNAETDIAHKIGYEIPDFIKGVTARDDVDGDLSEFIEADVKSVQWDVVGEYWITYSVYDNAGNIAIAKRKVIVFEN